MSFQKKIKYSHMSFQKKIYCYMLNFKRKELDDLLCKSTVEEGENLKQSAKIIKIAQQTLRTLENGQPQLKK